MASELEGEVDSDRPDEDGFNQGDLASVEKGKLLAPLPSNNMTEGPAFGMKSSKRSKYGYLAPCFLAEAIFESGGSAC